MTLMEQVLVAGCGAAVGGGLHLLWRTGRPRRRDLHADLDVLYAPPAGASSQGFWSFLPRQVVAGLHRVGLERALLVEDLSIAGRGVEAHTTGRLLHAAAGSVIAALVWVLIVLVVSISVVTAPLAVLLGAVAGVWVADRHVRRLATSRREESQLAVAAYLDLVRILVDGGLPLLAALRAAAESGDGWAFTELRLALSWAQDRSLPPDEGLRDLSERFAIAEFADLAATITSARRGASPVRALESKAAFLRGAVSARARAEAAVADAQIELPAAGVALLFMFFLAYPLMILISSTTGVLP